MPDMFEPPKTTPKIAVVGAGAMGSVYAGLFAEAGYDVTVVDIWAAHITAISEAGLRLEGASGDRVVAGIRAVPSVADAGPCDLYVIATKAGGVVRCCPRTQVLGSRANALSRRAVAQNSSACRAHRMFHVY